jgi:hypothetical protein
MMNHNAHTLFVVVQLQHLNSPNEINNCDLPSQATSQYHNLQILMLNLKMIQYFIIQLVASKLNNECQVTS